MIPAAFCIACAGAPSVPPPQPAASARPTAPAPAGEVRRLYNDYLNRLPCPEQAICGTGPEQPVTAVRCRPSPAPAEARCVFLVSQLTSDRIYRCEGAFSRRDGSWTMTGLDTCSLVSERARARFRLTEVPDRRTIEEIESGYALREYLMTAGVVDSDSMNRNSRVKVRRVWCTPLELTALCTYEADRCLEGEADGNGDGWCRRRVKYHVDLMIEQSLVASRGWTIDRAQGHR